MSFQARIHNPATAACSDPPAPPVRLTCKLPSRRKRFIAKEKP